MKRRKMMHGRVPKANGESGDVRSNFAWLLSGVAANVAADSMLEVVIPLIAVVTLHATAFEVSALMAIEQVSWLVLGLMAGVLVDRYRKRRLLTLAAVLRCLVYLSIPVAALIFHLTFLQLFIVAALAGVIYVFSSVAEGSVLPFMVERSGLLRANSVLEVTSTSVDLGMKSVASVIFGLIGAPLTVLIAAFGSGLAGLFFGRVRTDEPPVVRAGIGAIWREAFEGLKATFESTLFRTLVFSAAVSNFLVAAQSALLVYFLVRAARLEPTLVGILLASSSVGGLVGALLCSRLISRWPNGRVFRVALVVGPLFGLLIPFTEADWRVGLFVVGSAGLSAGMAIVNIIAFSSRQAASPPHLIGRISASTMFITWGVIPIGLIVGGALSHFLGSREALAIIQLAMFAGFAVVMSSPLRRREKLEEPPRGNPDARHPA